MSLQPKIYADGYRMVMVYPATWTCEKCGFRWASRLKALDVNVVVSEEDENVCPQSNHEGCDGGVGQKAPEKHIIYRDRRCGVTWPGPRNPGYLCVFGQREDQSPTVYKQTDLLVEAEEENTERFFDKISAAMKKLHCTWLLADRSDKFDTVLYSLSHYMTKRNLAYQVLGMEDTGGFEEARPVVDDMIKNDQLSIPKGTILRGQSGRITPIDLHTKDRVGPEERFWAMNAMNFCVVSWVAYPWKKPGKQKPPDIRR